VTIEEEDCSVRRSYVTSLPKARRVSVNSPIRSLDRDEARHSAPCSL
jgi:hypothetical protein